jgi:hypothetical protein
MSAICPQKLDGDRQEAALIIVGVPSREMRRWPPQPGA